MPRGVPQSLLIVLCGFLLVCGSARSASTAAFGPGDLVRLKRSETLLFKGANFLGAPKGQEFNVLQHDASRNLVFVGFYKPDGTLIAVTLPADALEASPPEGWSDLLRGVEAFRDGRYDDSRRLLVRASQDATYRQLAGALATRFTGAIAASQVAKANFTTTMQTLRDSAEQLCKQGNYSLGLAIDEGADRLATRMPGVVVPSKIDRDDISKRVTVVTRAVVNCRQAVAVHRLSEAARYIKEGLEAEPSRPELKSYKPKVDKDLAEAEERYQDADRMRKIPKGEVHALTALERGLKLCVDHPGLVSLKREMQGALEGRTAPPLTPALLTAAHTKTPPQVLEDARKLYTTRCTECHDLEMVDSRTSSSWQSIVSSMSRRAHINDTQQAQILEYLAVARNAVDTGQ